MPSRLSYIGGPQAGANFPPIQLQIEAINYLNRFSGSITPAYKNALNQMIWRLKQAGIWSSIQDLWLFAAPTQADALRNLISASRDATLTGAPTYSATAGFNITSGNTVNMPFSTSGIIAASSSSLYSALLDYSIGSGNQLVGPTSGQAMSVKSIWSIGTSEPGPAINGSTVVPSFVNGAGSPQFVAVAGGGTSAYCTTFGNTNGTTPTAIATSPIAAQAVAGATHQILAYGVIPGTLTAANYRKLCQAVQLFMYDVGVL